MNYNAKRARLSGVIYIILALMLAAIMCITFFTAISSRRENTLPEDTTPTADTSDRTNDTLPSVIPGTDNSSIVDVNPVTSPDDAAVNAEPSDEETKTPSVTKPTFFMPFDGIVTKEFSGNIPVFSITMNDYRVHAGIDIEAAEGSYVKSCASGIISNIYNDDLCATCISIDHGSGYVSCYRGLSDELPEGIVAGASVEAGTVIGTIDDGALFEVSQPAHLHFEMTVNGEFVDPLEYLPYNAEAAAAYYGE